MPLVPLRPLMEAAEKHNYAQGAFNVNAVAQAKAVSSVPVINIVIPLLCGTPSSFAQKGGYCILRNIFNLFLAVK